MKLAVLYLSLISCGPFQSALKTSCNQLFRALFASECLFIKRMSSSRPTTFIDGMTVIRIGRYVKIKDPKMGTY